MNLKICLAHHVLNSWSPFGDTIYWKTLETLWGLVGESARLGVGPWGNRSQERGACPWEFVIPAHCQPPGLL